MASLKEIKGRINSIKSTQKITAAMKMVASAKLHRAQAAIANMLPYEEKLFGMLTAFLAGEQDVTSPYTEVRPVVNRVAIVVFSSNSSLCGAFNANVIRRLAQMVDSYKGLSRENILIYPIGRKVAKAARKAGFNVQGDYDQLAEKPSYEVSNEIAYDLMKKFQEKEIDKVEILYHHMKHTSSQILTQETFLPISLDTIQFREAGVQEKETAGQFPDYIVEPSKEELIETLLPQAVALKLFTALLDSNASEHAARMLAMQIATDNANDLLQDLTIVYNKSRQQAITSELLDIIAGSMK